jgi:hypothetical protein
VAPPDEKALPILRRQSSSCGDLRMPERKTRATLGAGLSSFACRGMRRSSRDWPAKSGWPGHRRSFRSSGRVVVVADDGAVRNDRPADGGTLRERAFVLARNGDARSAFTPMDAPTYGRCSPAALIERVCVDLLRRNEQANAKRSNEAQANSARRLSFSHARHPPTAPGSKSKTRSRSWDVFSAQF